MGLPLPELLLRRFVGSMALPPARGGGSEVRAAMRCQCLHHDGLMPCVPMRCGHWSKGQEWEFSAPAAVGLTRFVVMLVGTDAKTPVAPV